METDWFTPTDPADLEAEMKKVRRKKAGRQFPWERGPIAWEISTRANEILDCLANHPRNFFSLRHTAKIFGISTQPVRDWVRRRDLKREGRRQLFRKDELCRFIVRLQKKAEPYDSEELVNRFFQKGRSPYPFSKLMRARFIWPREVKTLRPYQIAGLVGCHPSLVLQAIRSGRIKASRCSPCRWEITKRNWDNAFPFTAFSEQMWKRMQKNP